MKREGEVNSWNPAKLCGTIIDRSVNPPERYFLFASRVISGPEPYLGAHCLFDPDTRPPLPGKLPLAQHVEVINGVQP